MFLGFFPYRTYLSDPIALAYEIKDKIHDELGFTVNVGIGENKLCAKMASDFEKPDKVHTLFVNEIPDKMWSLPVRELLFVGGSTAKKLNDAGIRTIGELAKTDPMLQRYFSVCIHRLTFRNYALSLPQCPEPKSARSERMRNALLIISESKAPLKICLKKRFVLSKRTQK